MKDSENTETASLDVTVQPASEWDAKMSALKVSGMRMVRQMREQGHQFKVEILGPTEVQGGDSVPLRAVTIEPDWKMATRLEMVETAREMVTKAYAIESLDPALPHVLGSVIEGKGLYEHSVGEFFELYGRFQEKFQLKKESQTKEKMESLVNGDTRYLKDYVERGKSGAVPMPFAVRNILAHAGTNPNQIDQKGIEIRTSIDLLRSWLR